MNPNKSVRRHKPQTMRFVELKDGPSILLRLLNKEDESQLYDLLASCTGATLFERFHYAINVTHELAADLCRIDENRELAIVAELESQGSTKLIGLCRLVFAREIESPEYAILIIDDWQGKGLGRLMTAYCLELATARGVRCVRAVTTLDNFRMMSLFKELGFCLDYDWANGVIWATKTLSQNGVAPAGWIRSA